MTKKRFRACGHDILTGTLMLAAGIHVAAICLLAAVPPVSRDALTHHLALPQRYLQHGGIKEFPDMVVSYYPQLLDFLYCIPLYYKNDIIPKYIHFTFALGTAALLYCYLKNALSRRYGWLGALFFLTIPIIVKLSMSVYVDLGLVFFSTAALYVLVDVWPRKEFNWRFLCLAGICAGLGAGTKYNGLIGVLLLTLLLPFLLPPACRRSWRGIVFPICFFVVSMAVFSPWMIRNYAWTKNPVYPLAKSVFHSAVTEDIASGGLSATHFVARKYIYNESLLETLSTPVRIFFQGKDDDPQYFDGVLTPFLFILPFLAFMRGKKNLRLPAFFLASFSALLILIVFFKSDMRIRYMAPAIPGLVILSVFGLYNLRHMLLPAVFRSEKTTALIVAVVLLLLFSVNIRYMVKQFDEIRPVAFLTGEETRDQYIERYRPEYPLIQYLNHITGPDDRVMAIYLGGRRYYFDCDVRFAENLLLTYTQASSSVGALDEKIRGAGFTHIIVRYDLFNVLLKHRASSEERVLIEHFFAQNTVLLKSANGYGAYQIVNQTGSTDSAR